MCDSCEWEEAVNKLDAIIGDCEELPDAGESFGNDVAAGAENMRAWITEHEHCTDKQWKAIENWRDGVDRWFQD